MTQYNSGSADHSASTVEEQTGPMCAGLLKTVNEVNSTPGYNMLKAKKNATC